MAYSYDLYTGTGAISTYSLSFPYLEREHVVVSLNGVTTYAYTWLNSSQITMDAPVANGVVLSLRRYTPTTPLFAAPDGAVLSNAALTVLANQSLYLAQETVDLTVITLNAANAALVSANAILTGTTDAVTAAASASASATAAASSAATQSGTSTTSATVGTGSKSFTTQTGKQFSAGMWLQISDTAAPSTNYMHGQVASYDSGTGALVFNCTTAIGSGTKTAWTIYCSGMRGVDASVVITTRGDLVIGNSSNAPARLGIGSAGQFLKNDGTDVLWATLPSSDLSTGDVKLTLKTTADTGWVMFNDGSIGNASSAATTRANADTSALFTLLWTNVSDANAPVSGGRGASAAADFAANKRITLTKALGRALAIAGSGSGLTSRALGETLGVEAGTPPLAAHAHTLSDTYTIATATATADANLGGATVGVITALGTTTTPNGTSSAGPGGTMSVMQPTTFLNAMVKL